MWKNQINTGKSYWDERLKAMAPTNSGLPGLISSTRTAGGRTPRTCEARLLKVESSHERRIYR
jgi:hypothetical protein